MHEIGFDNERYLRLQSERIRERIPANGGKLYLEFGGKLFDDHHASRVLPGFEPDSKINMLSELRDQAEIVFAINANDIQKNKVRVDSGIPYDQETLRLIDAFRDRGLLVGGVVVTQWAGQPDAQAFEAKLARLGIPTWRHYPIAGYPYDVARIVSDEGYGRNQSIGTSRPLVVVTAPGPGSGKMAVCMSQLYHDHKEGRKATYAKFETFPIWNLPLQHPVNVAYEAATTDLRDFNLIDPFHLEAHGATAVNYNRDVEAFPVLRAILTQINGTCDYKSPTDMGVNMAGFCITDDAACARAAEQEVVRRWYKALYARRKGFGTDDEVARSELLMKRLSLTAADRPVVGAALRKQEETGAPAVALELPDGRLVTGKTTALLGASAAVLLEALKALAGIEPDLHLIAPSVIGPIQDLKVNHLGNANPRLHTDEVLVALSICATTDPAAERAMQQIERLRGSEAHASVILSPVDENVFKKLGVQQTCEPVYQTAKLFHK